MFQLWWLSQSVLDLDQHWTPLKVHLQHCGVTTVVVSCTHSTLQAMGQIPWSRADQLRTKKRHILLNCPECRDARSPDRHRVFVHKHLMCCFLSTLIQSVCGGSFSKKWWSMLKKYFFRYSFLAQHMPCPSTALLVLKRLSVFHSKRDWS